MALISVKRENYTRGENGLNCGDLVAQALNGLNLEQVYALGAVHLSGETTETLSTKYGHCNPGQQRMHVGNRLRAAARKPEFDAAAFTNAADNYRLANAADEAAAAEAKAAAKAQKAEAKVEAVTEKAAKKSRKKAA